MQKAY
jgi:hypothetical protein